MPAAVFFDTETTGMVKWNAGAGAPDQPHIMQLGAILQDLDTHKVLMEFNLLLQLPEGVVPEAKAVEVHGITPNMCATYGVKRETALKLFDVMLKKAELVVAHNMSFDALIYEAAVLRSVFLDMASFRNCRPFCTKEAATPICRIPSPHRPGTFKWPTLREAHDFFVKTPWDEEAAHDAMYDVRACAAVYWGIQDFLKQQ